MTVKRERDTAECNAKVAKAQRGERTVAQLVSGHGVHRTLVDARKRQTVEGTAVFPKKCGNGRDVPRG